MIAFERLVACAVGDVAPEEERHVEEHILSCGPCADLYATLVRLGADVAALVRAGGATLQITQTLEERVEHDGLVTRRYNLSPGDVVPCAVNAEDIYSLTTLAADLTNVERVDLVRGDQRIADVPFDRRGVVRLLTSANVLRTLPTMKVAFRLIAIDGAGRERIVAHYTLDHTGLA